MASDWATVQEDVRADAVTADACAIAAIVCIGFTVAVYMAPLGVLLRLIGTATAFGALFLFIFSIHFIRKARAAAEEINRTIDQLAWEEWVSKMPMGTRWVVGASRAPPGAPPPPSR
jgi:hypothetical protein